MAEKRAPDRVDVVVAGNPGPLTLDGSRTYIVGGDPCVVVDPGPALAGHLDAIEVRIGSRTVEAVCLTHHHPDHAGGARELALRLAAPVAATAATAGAAGLRPVEGPELEPPEVPLIPASAIEFDGGRLEAVPAPGHSADHVCFYWPEARALFAGDVILGEGTSMIAPPEGDMVAYLETLDRLAGLDLAVIYPGHGPRIDDPAAKIRGYIDHRLEREAQVLQALEAGARTPEEIRGRVYPDLDPALHQAAEGSIRAHIAKLVHEGRIEKDDPGDRPRGA